MASVSPGVCRLDLSSCQNFKFHAEGFSRIKRFSFERKDHDDVRSCQFQRSMCETVAAIEIFVVVCNDAIKAVNQGKPIFYTRSMSSSCFEFKMFRTSYGTYFTAEDRWSKSNRREKGKIPSIPSASVQ